MSPESNENMIDLHRFGLTLDRYVCYPMEAVTLSIKARLETPTRPLLCIHLPQNTSVEWVRMDGIDENMLRVYSGNYFGTLLSIPLGNYMSPGSTCIVQVRIRLNTIFMNHMLSFCVWMASDLPERNTDFFVEPKGSRSIELTVKNSANYLNFLPEVYNYDDFINRFLMMFESFWKPVNQQISQIENYFDPDLTPDVLLPWLATWVGMEIDESFPKDRIRRLIKTAIPFFQSRGTAQSLKMFLEMYSGGQVDVRERKAHNMLIGGPMGLGDGIALGVENKPNTIMVTMNVPSSELERTGFTEEKYSAKIKSFIRQIVPAHTVFSLSCIFE